jgi:hypothetical protein
MTHSKVGELPSQVRDRDKSAWKETKFAPPQKAQEEIKPLPKSLTAEEEQILKKTHDIAEMNKEESKKLSEQWTKTEKTQLKSREERRRSRKDK